MKGDKLDEGIYASGKNFMNIFWEEKVNNYAWFSKVTKLPFKFNDITNFVAWNESLMILCNESDLHIYYNEKYTKITLEERILDIFCTEKDFYAYTENKYLIILNGAGSIKKKLANFSIQSFCASNNKFVSINEKRDALINGTKKTKIKNAKHVGCTDDTVFIADDKDLYLYDNKQYTKLNTPNPICSIKCSDHEAFFLDNKGIVYQYNLTNISPIYGIPPMVSIFVGVQSFASITFEQDLYTWGFNPYGQLGTENDFPIISGCCPKKVFSNVTYATCGSNFILATTNGKNRRFSPNLLPEVFESENGYQFHNFGIVSKAEQLDIE